MRGTLADQGAWIKLTVAAALVDPHADLKRNREMVIQIRSALPKRGRVVIVTGCGHLECFRREFPHARVPLEA